MGKRGSWDRESPDTDALRGMEERGGAGEIRYEDWI